MLSFNLDAFGSFLPSCVDKLIKGLCGVCFFCRTFAVAIVYTMFMMKETLPIACDHAGFELKQKVITHLKERGFEVQDYGTFSTESCDYPDFAHRVGAVVEKGEYRRGIVICGSGNGVQMTVNKYPHVRCALCWSVEIARLGRQHNDANVLSLPARFISEAEALAVVDAFIDTPFEGGRHQRRVAKISQLL